MIRAIDSFVFVGLPVFAASSILLKRILNLKGTHLFFQLFDAIMLFRHQFAYIFLFFFLRQNGGTSFHFLRARPILLNEKFSSN